jgi:thymidine phosphorylase
MPHFNELMTCLLTEAPTRYCSSGERSMITAEIVMYFRGIAYGNQTLTNAKNQYQTNLASGKLHRMFSDMGGDSDYANQIERRRLVPDSRVIGAIEARLRDGTLSASDRDTIAAVAPEPIRKRLASIKVSTPLCPHNPWWAIWRGW